MPIDINKYKFNKYFLFFLFFNFAITQSPILLHLGVRGIFVLPLMLLFTLFFHFYLHINFSTKLITITFILFFSSLITSIFWLDLRILFLPLWSIIYLLTLSICTKEDINKLIDYLTIFFIILLIGAYISFFLALFGMNPISNLSDRFGATNIHFYGFTLTNAKQFSLIRPAGIYDEPGAFSFFICTLVFLRNHYKKNEFLSLFILLSGFITFSLTHLLFSFIYLISKYLNYKRLIYLFFLIIFFIIIIYYLEIDKIFEELLYSRLIDFSENFTENERYLNFINAFAQLLSHPYAFLFGLNPICIFEIGQCVSNYGMICCNPLEPITSTGILISWPYYFIIIYLAINGIFKRSNFINFGIVILFLQRPSVNSAGYTFVIFIIILTLTNNFYVQKK